MASVLWRFFWCQASVSSPTRDWTPALKGAVFVPGPPVCESLSHVWLFVTPRTVAHQAPLSVGFSRQEYWSGLSCPPPGDLPDPGIKPISPASAGGFFFFFNTVPPGKPLNIITVCTGKLKNSCNCFTLVWNQTSSMAKECLVKLIKFLICKRNVYISFLFQALVSVYTMSVI